MGVDNWGECPKCETTFEADLKKLRAKVKKSYGKRSLEDYKELESDLQHFELRGRDDSYCLREDYEIGIHDDKFYKIN